MLRYRRAKNNNKEENAHTRRGKRIKKYGASWEVKIEYRKSIQTPVNNNDPIKDSNPTRIVNS